MKRAYKQSQLSDVDASIDDITNDKWYQMYCKKLKLTYCVVHFFLLLFESV